MTISIHCKTPPHDVKVFTHYYPIAGSGEGFRWRTILQFEDSWEVIGSVVMKNPGSAHFLYPDERHIEDKELIGRLRKFDNPDTLSDNWYEFRSDMTMTCIGRLFAQRQENANKSLSGVIQIFNLFYLREADLGKALTKAKIFATPEKMTQYDIENMVAPIYLGFSEMAHNKTYGKIARRFFDKALELGVKYLDENFDNNLFIHPLYLMMYGKNQPECVAMREKFLGDLK